MIYQKAYKNYIFILLLFFTYVSCGQYKLLINKISDSGSSRATAYIDNNKIVSYKDSISYFTYLDNNDNGFQIKVMKVTPTQKESFVAVDNVIDNHGGGSIILDKEGYLHLFHSGHHGMLYHSKTVKKHNIKKWEQIDSLKGEFSYPSVAYNQKSNNLYILVREKKYKSEWNVSFIKKKINGKFILKRKLLLTNYNYWKSSGNDFHHTQSGYIRWNKSIVSGKDGNLFISFRNYEYTPKDYNYKYFDDRGGAAYFVSYLYSGDYGETWESNNNIKEELFYPEDLKIISGDSIPKEESGFHQISNIIHSGKKAYFLYSKTTLGEFTNLYMTELENGEIFKKTRLNVGDKKYEMMAPAAIVNDKDGNFFILATSVLKKLYCNCVADWGRDSNILILIVLNSKFEVIYKKKVDHKILNKMQLGEMTGPIWLPSTEYYKQIERKPTFMFTVGQKGNNNKEIIFNKVFTLEAIKM